QQHFTSKHVSEETSGQRNDAAEFRYNFNGKDECGRGHVLEAATNTVSANAEHLHRNKRGGAHGERHVQVSCGWAHKRYIANKDRAHTRQQAGEVCKDNKDKEARNEGENGSPELLASG